MTTSELLESFNGLGFCSSPFSGSLNAIVVSYKRGYLEFERTKKQMWINPANYLHEGIMSVIIDRVSGATRLLLRKPFLNTTINNADGSI